MAASDIAHGRVVVELDDSSLGPGLRKAREEWHRAMGDMDREKATARLDADERPLKRKLEQARRELRIVNAERASPSFDAKDAAFRKKFDEAQARVRRLDGQVAKVQIKTEGERSLIAAEKRVQSLNRMQDRSEAKYNRETSQVVRLQREYAKLSDKIEKLSKTNVFDREGHVKLSLDTKAAYAQMFEVKAALNRLGAHPPVGIKTEIDRRGLQHVTGAIGDVFRKIGKGAAGLSDMTLRLGPFTTSVKGAGIALAMLGPILTDLVGGATALGGVLLNAAAGFTAIGAGIGAGLLVNLAGVAGSLHPIITDFKVAKTATQAYDKAVIKFGAGSKEAKKAQEQMNNALKNVDPQAAQAARGISKISQHWGKLTSDATHKNVGKVLSSGFKALDTVLPVVAKNSNRSMTLIGNSLDNVFKKIAANSQTKGGGILGSLGRSANQFLAPALDGATHLAAAFAHVAESAARIFAGKAGQGFNQWASNIDKATQPGKKLDATITRLGNQARDVGRLFMDFGRLLGTVFNGGADSGQKLVNQLDHAIRSYNDFLKSARGQKSMHDFFKRSADGVSSLAGVLTPLIGAFGQWSSMLSPFTRGILDAIGFVARLFGGLTKVLSLGGPITVLGATFASLWAIGKLAGWIAAVTRVVALLKEARAAATFMSGLKIFTSGIGGALKGGGGMAAGLEAASAAGAAQFRAAIIEGATAGAAEMRSAAAGGALGGVGAGRGARALRSGEQALASGLVVPAGATRGLQQVESAAVKTGGGLRSAAARAAGFVGSLVGMTGPAGIAVGAIAAVTAAVVALGLAAQGGRNKITGIVDKIFLERIQQANHGMASANTRFMEARAGMDQFGGAVQRGNLTLKEARSRLAGAKKGTDEYRSAQLDVRDALRQHIQDQIALDNSEQSYQRTATQGLKNAQVAVGVSRMRVALLQQEARQGGIRGAAAKMELAGEIAQLGRLTAAEDAAANRAAAVPIALGRAAKGMIALTGQAEQSLGRLARQAGGKKIATTIGLKYEDPRKAARVGQAAASALRTGVGKGTVLKIIADSSNADAAVRRLQHTQIKDLRFKVDALVDSALVSLSAVNDKKVRDKVFKILGDAKAAKTAHSVIAHLPNIKKLLTLPGNNGPARAAYNAIRSMPNIQKMLNISADTSAARTAIAVMSSITLPPIYQDVFVRKHKATGGPADSTMQRANREATARQPRINYSGPVNRPTLIVGEENRREYVIATNPAYREDNVMYLRSAAQEMGYVLGERGSYGIIEAARGGTQPATAAKTRPKKKHPPKGRPVLPQVYSPHLASSYVEDSNDRLTQQTQQWIGQYNEANNWLNNHKKAPKKKANRQQWQSTKDGFIAQSAKAHDKLYGRDGLLAAQRQAEGDYTDYAGWVSLAGRLATRMNTYATAYNSTGTEADLTSWKWARGPQSQTGSSSPGREDYISNIIDMLTNLQGRSDIKGNAGALRSLRNEVEEWKGNLIDTQYAQPPTYSPEDTTAPDRTIEDFIKEQKLSGTLADRERAYSEAQLDNVFDDPTTAFDESTQNLGNDLTEANRLVAFWQDVYNRAVQDNQPSSVIGAAASAITGARGTVNEILGAQRGTATAATAQEGLSYAGQAALSDSARAQALTQYGSNYNPWAASMPLSGGTTPAAWTRGTPIGLHVGGGTYDPIPAGSQHPGGSSNVTVTNNFTQPPADPHTWSQQQAFELRAII